MKHCIMWPKNFLTVFKATDYFVNEMLVNQILLYDFIFSSIRQLVGLIFGKETFF